MNQPPKPAFQPHPVLWAVVDRNGQLAGLYQFKRHAEEEADLYTGATVVAPHNWRGT